MLDPVQMPGWFRKYEALLKLSGGARLTRVVPLDAEAVSDARTSRVFRLQRCTTKRILELLREEDSALHKLVPKSVLEMGPVALENRGVKLERETAAEDSGGRKSHRFKLRVPLGCHLRVAFRPEAMQFRPDGESDGGEVLAAQFADRQGNTRWYEVDANGNGVTPYGLLPAVFHSTLEFVFATDLAIHPDDNFVRVGAGGIGIDENDATGQTSVTLMLRSVRRVQDDRPVLSAHETLQPLPDDLGDG